MLGLNIKFENDTNLEYITIKILPEASLVYLLNQLFMTWNHYSPASAFEELWL